MSQIELLPTELLFAIAWLLSTRDLNSLAQANQRLCSRINPIIYRRHSSDILLWAAYEGIFGTAESALRYGADVDTPGRNGRTALGICAERGHSDLAMLLLKSNASINLQDYHGDSPLTLACCGNQTEEVESRFETLERLVYRKKEYESSDLRGDTNPGHLRIVEALLQHRNIKVNVVNRRGYTPLLQAVRLGHLQICNLLLMRDDVDVNILSASSSAPLHWATHFGHVDIVASLLKRPDLNINLLSHSSTALSEGAFWGRPRICKLLLQRRDVLVNLQKNTSKETPLFTATYWGHTEIVRLLLQRPEIDVNARDWSNMSPVNEAAKHGYTRILIMLLWHPDTYLYFKSTYRDTLWSKAWDDSISSTLLVALFMILPRDLRLRFLVLVSFPFVLWLAFRYK